MLSKQNLSSKIALVSLLALLVFFSDLKFQQWRSQRLIELQRQSLQDQADALQKQNDELSQSLAEINSPDFKESIAREQLGLKKQGEIAYGFTDNTTTPQNESISGQPSNFKKWWNYFFGN